MIVRERWPPRPARALTGAIPSFSEQQLTQDERMVRDTARAYCRDKLRPRVLEMFRKESTDTAIFREFGALDMLGIVIPEEYGGAGLNYVAYGLVAREVERIDSGFRSMMSVPGLARDGADQRVRHRSAEEEVPAKACDRASRSAASA
jgi:alkylation response protein AidB-like acyl-CoA dehydrogenase